MNNVYYYVDRDRDGTVEELVRVSRTETGIWGEYLDKRGVWTDSTRIVLDYALTNDPGPGEFIEDEAEAESIARSLGSSLDARATMRHIRSLMRVRAGHPNDPEEARRAVAHELENEAFKTAAQSELEAALSDPQSGWLGLVHHAEYRIDTVATEAEARKLVVDSLWDALFGGRPRPS